MNFHFAQIHTIPQVLAVAKIVTLSFIAFAFSFAITPLISHFLYKYKIGIKIKDKSVDGKKLSFISKLHKHKEGTPTMGGVIIWLTVLILAILMSFLAPWLSEVSRNVWVSRLDFLSRSQTWLPLLALIATALLGLVDDYMSVRGIGNNKGGGMRFFYRFSWIFLIALAGALWFYFKLDWSEIHVPAVGDFEIGLWYIPLFIFVIIFSAISSNETDGLDGLNAGILAQAFSVLAVISFFQHRMDLAAFCGIIAGSLLAFLWFNFYPARFFMGDTGAVALGATLGVVVMLTNSVLVLPFIVMIYFLESGSAAIQLISKRFFNKKVFLAAPLHHHFEAEKWPETKVTVRFWIINAAFCILGVLIGIIGSGR